MMNEQETEVKFYLSNPSKLLKRLEAAGAVLLQPRVLEINLRFDTPERELSKNARVLRLRQDTKNHFTYKGPGFITEGVLTRQEIELTLDDFQRGKLFLEALGYEVILTYEKYRQTYGINDLLVTIDDMPYGTFSEIEGPNGEKIKNTALLLQLDWNLRINTSYADIFRMVKTKFAFSFKDLTFENFQDIYLDLDEIGIFAADIH
jgi:adenylate cyclase class 2